jgi:hypothetical protein
MGPTFCVTNYLPRAQNFKMQSDGVGWGLPGEGRGLLSLDVNKVRVPTPAFLKMFPPTSSWVGRVKYHRVRRNVPGLPSGQCSPSLRRPFGKQGLCQPGDWLWVPQDLQVQHEGSHPLPARTSLLLEKKQEAPPAGGALVHPALPGT